MLPIILKIILSSSVFIAVYYLFLEKEKMYQFNRFYLLCSLILSYIIPFISITVQHPRPETKPQLIIEETAQQIILAQPIKESFDWMNLIWLIYGLTTLFFMIRSFRSIAAVKKIKGAKLVYQNYNVMVTSDNLSPFSFWNTIYLGESYIKNNTIDPRIFLHEKSHIDQKHSIDIIVMDLLKIFTWFNPVLFLYKKAIITNHEFLADETVLKNSFNVKDYQSLILEEIIGSQNLPLTHSFNFNNTKKRFIMMAKKKSKFILLKKMSGITVLIAAAALFAEKTYAANSTVAAATHDLTITKTNSSLTQDPYQEFQDILSKYADLLNNGKYAEFSKKVSDPDKKRLELLFPQLTDAQRSEQKITFFTMPDLKKRVPTESELTSFLNKSNYAVWIDSKKIENTRLKNYKPTDFSNVFISRVGKNARTAQNPQPYQVTLMTHNYFEKSRDERPQTAMGFKKEIIRLVNDTIQPKKTIQATSNEGKDTNPDKDFIEAEYPGGLAALRKKIGETFNTALIEPQKGVISSIAYISIDETGKATKISVSGDNKIFTNELIRIATMISNETAWKPASKNGKATATTYKLPLTMTFL